MAGNPTLLTGGIGDLFQGIGNFEEAGAYATAARLASQNAIISREAGDIKLAQASRQIYKVIGAQKAEYAGAGLTGGGSAQEVLRSSISQGALEKAIINEQTQINVNAYEAEAAQFKGMQQAADAAGVGDIISGIASFAMFSDRRLKTDIEQVGSHGTLGLYRFRFIGQDDLHVGVMADEVAIHAPYALGSEIGGYATVDYSKLGLQHLVEG